MRNRYHMASCRKFGVSAALMMLAAVAVPGESSSQALGSHYMTSEQCRPLSEINYRLCCTAFNRTAILTGEELRLCPPMTTSRVIGLSIAGNGNNENGGSGGNGNGGNGNGGNGGGGNGDGGGGNGDGGGGGASASASSGSGGNSDSNVGSGGGGFGASASASAGGADANASAGGQ